MKKDLENSIADLENLIYNKDIEKIIKRKKRNKIL
jgi:hypothetical protein